MFYDHISLYDCYCALTEDRHCARSAITSFLRNVVHLNDSRVISLFILFIYLFIYTTFIKRSIHKQTCSNALFNK